MIKFKSLLFALTLALALGATALLVPSTSSVDALVCGDGSHGQRTDSWESTPEAIARTAAGECGPDGLCKEWCTGFCDDPQPTGVFQCFPK
ncbi:MAG: hypothetical protein AAGC60_25855 [Acidobacteriota bacterium]